MKHKYKTQEKKIKKNCGYFIMIFFSEEYWRLYSNIQIDVCAVQFHQHPESVAFLFTSNTIIASRETARALFLTLSDQCIRLLS